MVIIVFGRAIQFFLSLVMLRVSTTLLAPAEMGTVSLVLTTTAFFALFFINPVGMFINRRLHSWSESGVARDYLIRYAQYLLLVALFATVVLPIFYITGIIKFGVSIGWLIVLVTGSLIFNTINQTTLPSLNLLGDSYHFVVLTLATVATSFIFAVLFVKLVIPSANYWLVGILVGQASFGMIGVRILFKKLRKQKQGKLTIGLRHVGTLFNFAWPVSLAAGLAWLQSQGYRYVFETQLGLAQLGIFVAGYSISAGVIAGFESILTTYFQPRLYRDANSRNLAVVAEAWPIYAAAVIPPLVLTVAFVIILAPELIKLLLGESFQAAADFAVWGALVELSRVLVGVYSLIAYTKMRTQWLIFPNLVGAVLSITFCWLLAPRFGAVGVCIGLVISGVVIFLLTHFLLARYVIGRVLIQRTMMAILAAAMLWLITIITHQLNIVQGRASIVVNLMLVSLVYLALQYLLLRKYLKDPKRT